jgi:hypothetical protein
MQPPTASEFLKDFQKERPYLLVPGNFEDVPDEPSFTVDQRAIPLVQPPYTKASPNNSALLG